MCGDGEDSHDDVSLRAILSTPLPAWRQWLVSRPYTQLDVHALFASNVIVPRRGRAGGSVTSGMTGSSEASSRVSSVSKARSVGKRGPGSPVVPAMMW
jgi:hypothetical protein